MREVLAWSGIAAILVPCFVFTPLTLFPGPVALLPVLGTAAVMHCAPGTSVERALSFGWVQYTGRISYSLYLWHWPLIVFARYAAGMQPASHFAVPLLAGSFALAALSYRFVELPFHKRGISNRRDIFRGASIATAATLAFCIVMVGTRAYEDRFSPQVLAFDSFRHPEVPFTRCVGVELSKACTVGGGGAPSVVLWGDSHMLAWVPALDQALRAANQSAIVAVASSCPPFKDLSRMRISSECQRTARELAAMLRDRPGINTVVMGAIWSSYLGSASNKVQPPTPYASPAAPQALADTVDWLVQAKRKVVVLGPVPIFDADVPLMLALDSHTGGHRLHTEAARERERNREFFDVARSFDAAVTVVDPIPWLCTPACAPQIDGLSLYRDAHHLSEAGALHIAGKLHGLFASTAAP